MPRPFEAGNPGRPKGALNKSTKTVKAVFAEVFESLQEEGNPASLREWAKQEPTEFYKLASKLIPTQLDATVNQNINVLNLDPLSNIDDTGNDSITEDSGS